MAGVRASIDQLEPDFRVARLMSGSGAAFHRARQYGNERRVGRQMEQASPAEAGHHVSPAEAGHHAR
jgi:hypothetical protein